MIPGNEAEPGKPGEPWRRRLHEVIFESETPAGRRFDKVIIVAIPVSVAVVPDVRLAAAAGPARENTQAAGGRPGPGSLPS